MKKQKWLSILLGAALMISMLAITVLAEEPDSAESSVQSSVAEPEATVEELGEKPMEEATEEATEEAGEETDSATRQSSHSVDITWGAMEFTYSDRVWDPDTHTYTTEGWAETGNTVTVENNGTQSVLIDLYYINKYPYSFNGSWDTTQQDQANGDPNWNFVAAGNAKTFVLTLSGTPTEAMDSVNIGTVEIMVFPIGE